MTAVTIVGMIAGGILLLAAVGIFLTKKEFTTAGAMVTVVSFLFIGMSQWSSIKIKVGGVELEAVRKEIAQTARAVDDVAAQTEQADEGIEAIKLELANLARELDANKALPGTTATAIRARIDAMPKLDRKKLDSARERLRPLTVLKTR